MEFVAKVFDCAACVLQDDGGLVIGKLPARLGVDARKVEVGPHLLEQLVKVPFVVRRDGHGVGQLGDDVELLDRDLVNLVEHVDGRDVHAVALDHVDEVVGRSVALERDICAVDPILAC